MLSCDIAYSRNPAASRASAQSLKYSSPMIVVDTNGATELGSAPDYN